MLAIEQATAPRPRVGPAITSIINVKGAQPPSFLNALLWEYGLIGLSAFVPNQYTLLGEGRQWLIDRDTFAAIIEGLGWISVAADILEAPARRNWWNSFQLGLHVLPPDDDLAVSQIETITNLSKPFRSDFRRGVYLYDAGAAEADFSLLDNCLLDTESGVRLHAGGPLWSFGAPTEVDHTLTESEGTALGIWTAPESAPLTWGDITFPWSSATFPWVSDAVANRAILMANSFSGRLAYIVLRDSGGQVIGYRRARAIAPVSTNMGGKYRFGALHYLRDTVSPSAVFFEAMTGFGDGAGQTAAQVGLLIDPVRAGGVPSGRLWLAPGQLSGGHEIAIQSAAIELRQTVRQQIKFLLRF